jgi:ATP-dependent Lon protease
MPALLLVPVEDTVVFPTMTVTLPVQASEGEHVVVVPRHDSSYARVGTVCEVIERVRLPGGGWGCVLSGVYRGIPGAAMSDPQGELRVSVSEKHDALERDEHTRELEREYRAVVEELGALRGDNGRVGSFLHSVSDPGALADTAGYSPDLSFEQKVWLLEELDVEKRLTLAISLQRERLAELEVSKKIRSDVEEGARRSQREYFLRQQLESIRRELDGGDGSVASEYERKIAAAGMPARVLEQAQKELDRLQRMGESQEAPMVRTYLDWLCAVPWSRRSTERLDPDHAREVLDADHEGLEKVKDRVTEYLAVHKLRGDRGIEDKRRSGVILTLIGPPGTGKTSVGESIARATGREFVRMSLGGLRDEAEIRGHRRTYIGALPGRLVRALSDAKTMNPVIMLDEVDKVGADWHGDPTAALLEVLDPEQNHSFRDHYLDVELDLSEVLFIATANVADTIPPLLLDRMEPIFFDGYTTEEKVAIARKFLWPRQLRQNGLQVTEAMTDDAILRMIAMEYTREAGVRQLERELGAVLRKTATQIAEKRIVPPVALGVDEVRDALGRPRYFAESIDRTAVPGVATGLAVTGAGGEVLFVEAASMPGSGRLVLTGQLGEVMKESARIALSYMRAHSDALHIPRSAFERREFHIHVPAGAVPKDGPSAGVAIVTAICSLATQRSVKHNVGMTGEVTLQGRVLPVGGIKQKILAAHAAGLSEVIIPERNRADLDEVPEEVRSELTFHPVMTIDEVLELALEPTHDVALS